MVADMISEFFTKLDVESIVYLVISIAIYSIFIWHFYRFIARRDCFKISPRKHPRLIGFLKYFFIFPFVAFLFFIGFALIMYFVAKNYEDLEQLLFISFAIVLTIRLTAYYSEDLSKDLAKMLPFALLGIFLVDPTYFNFGSPQDIINRFLVIPEFFTAGLQYILVIVVIEWVLRILLAIKQAIFHPKSEPAGEEQ